MNRLGFSRFDLQIDTVCKFFVLFLGSVGGLNLNLNARQYEYPRMVLPGAGFLISIHEPNVQVREVFYKSLLASVGQMTRIAIEQTNVNI